MDKQKKSKILRQVKLDRAARRLVDLELGLPKVVAKVHKTSKKDVFEKTRNTVKEY